MGILWARTGTVGCIGLINAFPIQIMITSSYENKHRCPVPLQLKAHCCTHKTRRALGTHEAAGRWSGYDGRPV